MPPRSLVLSCSRAVVQSCFRALVPSCSRSPISETQALRLYNFTCRYIAAYFPTQYYLLFQSVSPFVAPTLHRSFVLSCSRAVVQSFFRAVVYITGQDETCHGMSLLSSRILLFPSSRLPSCCRSVVHSCPRSFVPSCSRYAVPQSPRRKPCVSTTLPAGILLLTFRRTTTYSSNHSVASSPHRPLVLSCRRSVVQSCRRSLVPSFFRSAGRQPPQTAFPDQ